MTTTPRNDTPARRKPRKGKGLIIAAIAGGLMFAAVPSVTQAAPRGDRDNNRGNQARQTQRHNNHNNHNTRANRGNRGRADRHSNHNNKGSHTSRHNRHDHDRRNKGSFNLSFLFGSPRVVRSHTTVTRVYVAGRWSTTVIPAVYETHYEPCGTPIQVLVRPAHSQRVWIPSHYSDHCSHGCCTSGGAHSNTHHSSSARISIGGRF